MEKKKVKERQHARGPKVADASRKIPRHMKTGYRKVNEQITPAAEQYDSPSDYATQKSEQYTYDTAVIAYSGTKKAVRKVKDKIEEKIRDKAEDLEKRWERKEAERMEHEQPQRYDTQQMPANSSPAHAQSRPDISGHEVAPKQKTEVLQQRFNQPEPKQADTYPSQPADPVRREFTVQEKAEILQKQRTDFHKPDIASNPTPENTPYKGGNQYAAHQTARQTSQSDSNRPLFRSEQRPAYKGKAAGQKSVSSVKQGAKGTVKTTEKTVKTTEKTVKTADRSVKAAEKTAKTATKAAEKAAKAAEKAAKVAKEIAVKAAKAAQKAAEMTAKAIQAAVKAIVAAIKALVAAIAAGGWVAVVIILVIALIALIVCSCFGLFWSNDSDDGPSMTEIVQGIDQGYKNAIEKRIKRFEDEIEHDEFEVVYKGDNNDGDSAAVNNWIDVLAVYSVLTTTGDNPIIIFTPDEECVRQLSEVFFTMNTVGFTYELHKVVPEDAPEPTPDPDGNIPEQETITLLIVNVHQRSMTYREAAEYYRFDESQMQLLEEMMSPAYTKYYAALIGVDLLGGADYTEIISHLPSNSKGADVVRAALTKLGCPYVWGAKGSSKFDCSGLAYWAIHEVDPELGDHMYTNAAGQAKYCHDRGLLVAWSELEPGDLVFWVNKKCEGCHRWKEIHHVGIYVGDGKVVEASSSKGCVVVRDLWQTKNYPIIMFGRPYQ